MIPKLSMAEVEQFFGGLWPLLYSSLFLQMIPCSPIWSNELRCVCITRIYKIEFTRGYTKTMLKWVLWNSCIWSRPLPTRCTCTNFRSKSHATMQFCERPCFLFLYGSCCPGGMVMGKWVPSIAPRQFCKFHATIRDMQTSNLPSMNLPCQNRT